jgi:hypothetical protein
MNVQQNICPLCIGNNLELYILTYNNINVSDANHNYCTYNLKCTQLRVDRTVLKFHSGMKMKTKVYRSEQGIFRGFLGTFKATFCFDFAPIQILH